MQVESSLPLCGFWESNLGLQAWEQVPVPADPSLAPLLLLLSQNPTSSLLLLSLSQIFSSWLCSHGAIICTTEVRVT